MIYGKQTAHEPLLGNSNAPVLQKLVVWKLTGINAAGERTHARMPSTSTTANVHRATTCTKDRGSVGFSEPT